MDWAAAHGGHDAHLADVEGLREAVALTAEVVSRLWSLVATWLTVKGKKYDV